MTTQVLDYLQGNLDSTPDSLGDPRKETPEEMADRHDRVLATTLLALAGILDITPPPSTTPAETPPPSTPAAPASGPASESASDPSAARGGAPETPPADPPGPPSRPPSGTPPSRANRAAAEAEIVAAVGAVIDGKTFFRLSIGSKSPVVRRAGYCFVAFVASR